MILILTKYCYAASLPEDIFTASLGTLWNSEYLHSIIGSTEMFKPNGMILCYPVITSGKYRHKGSIESILGKKSI